MEQNVVLEGTGAFETKDFLQSHPSITRLTVSFASTKFVSGLYNLLSPFTYFPDHKHHFHEQWLDRLDQFMEWKTERAAQASRSGSAVQVLRLQECTLNMLPSPFYIGENWEKDPGDPENDPHSTFRYAQPLPSPRQQSRYPTVAGCRSQGTAQRVKPFSPPCNRILAGHDVEFMEPVKARLVSMGVQCFF
ncbi:hypothetical protein GYMLUDRAFT_236707 [Collybiopsis luxurians FD-317 M1]|nr:hypothetical protein GYMLUDRAFT_236707 [Collybiopsis luxurians FD-317 M1]